MALPSIWNDVHMRHNLVVARGWDGNGLGGSTVWLF